MESKSDETLKLKYTLYADIKIAQERFAAAFLHSTSGMEVQAVWLNKGGMLSVGDMAKHFDIALPDFLDWEIAVKSAAVEYTEMDKRVSFCIVFSEASKLTVFSKKKEFIRTYQLSFDARISMPFANVPILGKLLSAEDGLKLSDFSIKYDQSRELTLTLSVELTLGGKKHETLNLELRKTPSTVLGETAVSNSDITWKEINKSFKIINIYRLGFSLSDGLLRVYLDATFSFSVLQMDFYGLYFSTRLPRAGKFSFGLSGLLVSFNKPPLSISGGFYKVPNKNLYNGTLKIGLFNLTFTALGSYGELQDGETSVFIYLMLDYPIGGPPFFFVTGLAAGFGINREFTVPELKDIRSFPFVAAALKMPGALSPQSTPSQALSNLSNWLTPLAGNYFVTAGVAFKSFNMFQSFALLSIAFGNKTQISLLGISTVSMPPTDSKGGEVKDPLAYAQLDLRAVYDPSEGYFEIVAALTNESYIFDKKCKLTGGFAFCVWSKGKYAGDFIITLGGCHHPSFKNTHYPIVNKIGINWQINSNLSLKGGGYFALTPSCMMAGANLDLTYSIGNLKAWLYADMAFFLRWKPFFYDISLFVALGVSYRCFMLFGYVTFKLEISASLHIWGPEFSGTACINLWIISFTIKFGAQAQPPKYLNWDEFFDSFLFKETPQKTGFGTLASRGLLSIKANNCVLREIKENNIALLERCKFNVITNCEIPSTELSFHKIKKNIYDSGLGVVPMAHHNLTSTHTVTVTDETGCQVDMFGYEIITQNIPPALWYNGTPDPNADMILNVPVGISIKPKSQETVEQILPPTGFYTLETLLEHEPTALPKFSWANRTRPRNALNPDSDIYTTIKNTFGKNDKRDKILAELSKKFHTEKIMVMGEIAKKPKSYFLAKPVLCTTGSRVKEGG